MDAPEQALEHIGVNGANHVVTKAAKVFVKNVAGIALIIAGCLLSLPFVPGPGTVLIFAGLAIADWPGKRQFFRWLHTFPWFARIDAWFHAKFGIRMPHHPGQMVGSNST